jgi:extracellular elastinolytic metalloproteinase
MNGTFSARRRHALPVLVAVVAVAVALIVPAGAAIDTSAPDHSLQGDSDEVASIDLRSGRDRPTARQRDTVRDLDASVRWNRFGTPQSLVDPGGFLAAGLPSEPVAAARTFLRRERSAFGLSTADVTGLEVLGVNAIGRGNAVLFRQQLGGLPAGHDGLVAVAVRDGRVAYLSSTLTETTTLSGSPTLSEEAAFAAAARSVGRPVAAGGVEVAGTQAGWTKLTAPGFDDAQMVRLVALPMPAGPARPAYETVVADPEESLGSSVFVDAATGEVLIRESLIDHATDNPKWKVFRSYPPLNYSSTDTRVVWCGIMPAPDCERVVDDPASPFPWDVDAVTGTPTFQTRGNNARATEKWNSPTPGGSDQGVNFSSSSTRDYVYPWTNQWFVEGCDPAVLTPPSGNDIDSARANLHAMHNRMHDWAYRLGFTETTWNGQAHNFGRGEDENDPEHGNAQAGAISGGFPNFAGRDNANQFTPPDGQVPVTNMFLWQAIPAAFYAPCVDGDYDMSVIGHEYTHMISNRMVGGPDGRLLGLQANAMGESWSDYVGTEYLMEYGFIPVDQDNPFAIGAYATGDQVAGIRNYGMNQSPLNYSDVGYDFACTTNNQGECVELGQVHADGEIWSATLFDLRTAFNARYGPGSPATQAQCADGALPVTSCPGNRRLVQLIFDAWLLMTGPTSMVDARNAMLASDQLRFNGINADILWNGFARRGLGQGASSAGSGDVDPAPDFTSPHANEATVVFRPTGDNGPIPGAQLFVGRYEARVTPVADTDPATPLDASVDLVPGTYELLARADGFGHQRVTLSVRANQVRNLAIRMRSNLASSANGGTAAGDGVNLAGLIDDTEATNWAFLGSTAAPDPVQEEAEGKQVTVRLDPSRDSHRIGRVQVSALLRPRIHTDPADPGTQNRFTALRSFEILTCRVRTNVDCTQDAQFQTVLTSMEAFPSVKPRPRAPDMLIRSFDIPDVQASFVRLRVLENQCTGNPDFLGEQDDDPRYTTDCINGSTADDAVRAAELQVFRR